MIVKIYPNKHCVTPVGGKNGSCYAMHDSTSDDIYDI